MKNTSLRMVAAVVVALSAPSASMALDVSPNIIFGSGNANGSFTVKTVDFPNTNPPGSVELGLRAKLRYDESGIPQNIFNWDGDHTYTFAPTAGTPSNRSVFNFEWSIYSDGLGTFEQLLNAGASAFIEFDIDPSANTNFVRYNPFDGGAYYGDINSANGSQKENEIVGGPTPGATVAQQSVNYGFLTGLGAPLGPGSYDVKLGILNNSGNFRDATEIKINVVPVPAALPLLFSVVGGIAWMKRRSKTAKA